MGAMLEDHEARLEKLESRSEYSTIDVNRAALGLAIESFAMAEMGQLTEVIVGRARRFAEFIWESAAPETVGDA